MPLKKKISKLLMSERHKQGLTQTQLAEKANLKQSQIARIEKGENAISFATLERVARALGRKVKIELSKAV